MVVVSLMCDCGGDGVGRIVQVVSNDGVRLVGEEGQ